MTAPEMIERSDAGTGIRWLTPRVPVAPGVNVVTTLRVGGASGGTYAGLNLAEHVGDDPAAVVDNRRLLREGLALPAEPLWLRQVHGTRVVAAEAVGVAAPEADAALARVPGAVLVVLTADCLPVVFASDSNPVIAIAHAGWRGLAAGVLEATVAGLAAPLQAVRAWIGPGIGAAHYEVDETVREAFADAPGAEQAFRTTRARRWHCDLALLAKARLEAAGVAGVRSSGACTFSAAERFYSFRRDGQTGRMATLVWRARASGSVGA